jgi:hypothetical protein
MIVATNRNDVQDVNAWPKEVEDKLISLEPGEIVKVRINPNRWFTVFEQRGTSQNYNQPTSSGNVKKLGEHGVPSPWAIRFERQPYLIGFLEGYDSAGRAIYGRPLFDQNGELTFNGSRVGDRERFLVMQLHPQMRIDPLTGLERKSWKFEVVDVEKESNGITQNFEVKLALLNKIKDLDESSLNMLMKGTHYERMLFSRPDYVGKVKASRAFLIKKIEEGKIKEITDAFKNLEEINKISLVYDGLVAKKLICTESKLVRYDGREIITFAEEISIPNMETAAINIFKYSAHSADFNEHVIDFLREGYEAAKTTVHKSKR